MTYEPKNFDHLIGTPGFSEPLLKNHFTLYQGYVKNVNTLMQERESLIKEEKGGTPAYGELTRRLGWEFNGMRLHELYFGNMASGGKAPQTTHVAKKMVSQFGSPENWKKDFQAVSTMRGIGWAVLYYDQDSDKLFNVWVNEHDMGHLAGAKPLLVLDIFEHAYTLDYGIKKADYIEAFSKAIDWEVVENRFGK